MDADGDFVVTWQSKGQDGDSYGVYAQRYNANGIAAGGELQVNTVATGKQVYPTIAMDADGDFVVAWGSDYQEGSYGVYARRYSANGTAVDIEEFQVNTHTTGNQNYPSIAMDADGDFVVTWSSLGQDEPTSFGIYAQRYNADGGTAGGELKVNSYTTSHQIISNIAIDADGDFVVVWKSRAQEGVEDSYGIYAQRYLGAGETVDLKLVVQDDTDPATVGNNFVYSLITTNKGSGIAMDVNLSTNLPTGLVYVSDDAALSGWTCTELATTLNCNKPFMTAAAVDTIDVTVKATAAGTLSNTVTATAAQTDVDTADNTDTETTEVKAAPVSSSSGALGVSSLLLALPLWLRRRFMR